MDLPQTPPDQIINTPTTLTPSPKHHVRTASPAISSHVSTYDPLLYGENRDGLLDFDDVPVLKGGDFKGRPTEEDLLGRRLASRESVLSARSDPPELKFGAKLSTFIEKIDPRLMKTDKGSMSLSGRCQNLRQPEVLVKSAQGSGGQADRKNSKLSSQKTTDPTIEFGGVLPPSPRGLQNRATEQKMKSLLIKSVKPTEEVGTKFLDLLKNTDLLQALAEVENPVQAEEDRAKHFMNRLSHVQAASRRLQGQLDIHSDTTWPLPPLPSDRNPFIIEVNAIKIRTALENCKDFAVPADRESAKLELLDVVAKSREKRSISQIPKTILKASKEEKKARKAEVAARIAPIVVEKPRDGARKLEDEGMSRAPPFLKAFFHKADSQVDKECGTRQGQNAAGQRVDTSAPSHRDGLVVPAERDRREQREDSTKHTHPLGINSHGHPDYDGRVTSELVHRSQATDGRGREIERASSVSEKVPPATTPLNQGLQGLSVHDTEVEGAQSSVSKAMAVLKAQDEDRGKEMNPEIGDMTSYDPRLRLQDKWVASSFGSIAPHALQKRDESKAKQIGQIFGGDKLTDAEERHREIIGLGRKELDVAASIRNHSITFVDVTQPKAKERNPAVPQPDKMPNTLTEAICSYMPLEAKSVLTLTLERVDPPLPSPTDQRCILLKHFEIGLDGVEGLCQGTAKIPESPEMTAEREKRVGRLGTFKQEDGGFYRSLKCAQQKEQQYGKGYWYFFGVKFKQTSKERKRGKGGKWFLFGAPIEAVHHLDIKRSQENVVIMLGGGLGKAGNTISPFKANFKRTHTLFSRGGLAPMDIWPGGEDWDGRVFEDIRAAMANTGLRVGFLYADTEIFTRKPMGFPAASQDQADKKRKQSGPNMTEEEMKAMESSMRPKKLSAEDIGAILTENISKDRAKQDAASCRC